MAILDLRKLMELLSSGKALDSAAHRLGARASRVDVDEELSKWGLPKAGPLRGIHHARSTAAAMGNFPVLEQCSLQRCGH